MLWRHLTPRTPHWLPVGASPLLRPEGVFSRVLGGERDKRRPRAVAVLDGVGDIAFPE